METGIIAVPSILPGGLDVGVSPHFGQCDVYTLIDVNRGHIEDVSIIPSLPHQHGGCLEPVRMLADRKVTAIVVGGMGMRPLKGFSDAGIRVYQADTRLSVLDAVISVLDGAAREFMPAHACGGH
ncbi:MAG: NifB/NifX family molybdenum-iron cluster-binding protein [Rhodospirillaceae bacterium]